MVHCAYAQWCTKGCELLEGRTGRPESSLDQTVFPDTAALKECLKGVNRNEDGYYTVSTLAEMAYVLRKLQEEKARQEAAEERRKRGK